MVFEFKSISRKEESSFYNPLYGNYKFDTTLTYFGLVRERKFRKVNRLNSLLKLDNIKDSKSIFPMIDEFGYSFSDFFIFKSSWDQEFFIETTIEDFFKKDLSKINDKFYEKNMSNPSRVINDWQTSLDFEVGRPKINNNYNNI